MAEVALMLFTPALAMIRLKAEADQINFLVKMAMIFLLLVRELTQSMVAVVPILFLMSIQMQISPSILPQTYFSVAMLQMTISHQLKILQVQLLTII